MRASSVHLPPTSRDAFFLYAGGVPCAAAGLSVEAGMERT